MEIRTLPQMVYVAVRTLGPYQETAGPAFDRLMAFAADAGLVTADASILGLSWDGPGTIPDAQLRYDAAITVPRSMRVPKGFHVAAIPEMRWLMATHRGSYSGMTASFGKLMVDMESRDDIIPVNFCAIEIYRSEPETAEADLVTEIGFPVVQAG